MEQAQNTWLAESSGPVGVEIRGLVRRVDLFCNAKNWTHGYFGKHVAGDDTIVNRLRQTGKVQARLILRIEEFLSENEAVIQEAAE